MDQVVRKRASRGRLADGSPNPVDAHVGARLRLRPTLLGQTQQDMAKALGLTFQQVQKYERGANRIGASRLYDIACALGVPVSYFFQDMPAEVEAASPRLVHPVTPPVIASLPDPISRRETLELVCAYYRIKDPVVRHRFRELLKTLASRLLQPGESCQIETSLGQSGPGASGSSCVQVKD